MICYVLDIDGKPLMPVHRNGRVRKKLDTGEARLVSAKPLTIRLTYRINNPVTDQCLLGIDPGRTNIGLCAIDSRERILYASDVETRIKMVVKLMLERKRNRRASRSGERKVRQRRMIACDKTGLAKETEIYRMLPGCKKAIRCKVIKNTKAKFNNRTRPEGWLTPTANQLLETHMSAIHLVQRILPVSAVVLEINKFAFMKLDDKTVRGIQYQRGKLHGFASVKEAVSFRQNGKCLLCGKPIGHYHHIVPRGRGSENIDNIAGLCMKCHDKVHKDVEAAKELASLQEGLLKKYGALSVLNQIIPALVESIKAELPLYVTDGYTTSITRNSFGLSKEHYVDAWCIAVSALESIVPKVPVFSDVFSVMQFRRHDRQNIHAQHERLYKDGRVIIARNRRKRTDQKTDSLHEFYGKQKELNGRRAARQMLSRLTVVKSARYMNTNGRKLPGSIFKYKGKTHILGEQITYGKYYHEPGDKTTNYPVRECKAVRNNTGLVYM